MVDINTLLNTIKDLIEEDQYKFSPLQMKKVYNFLVNQRPPAPPREKGKPGRKRIEDPDEKKQRQRISKREYAKRYRDKIKKLKEERGLENNITNDETINASSVNDLFRH